MPCCGANGLFPGRGPPPRGPGRGAVVSCLAWKGLLPGRAAPGFGAAFGPGFGAAGFAAGFGVAGFASGSGSAGFGSAGLGSAGLGTAGFAAGFGAFSSAASACGLGFGAAAFGSSAGALACSAFGAAGFAGLGFGAAGLAGCGFAAGFGFSAGAAFSNSARRRFTTGGSIVEEAEDTNSPISSSLLSASREGIPSCLATSWTRNFATILLFWLNRGLHYLVHNRDSGRSNVCSVVIRTRPPNRWLMRRELTLIFIVGHSSCAHRVSISSLTRFHHCSVCWCHLHDT